MVVEIPSRRLDQPRPERLFGSPSEFALQLARIDGITVIMAGPIGDKSNMPIMWPAAGMYPVKRTANSSYYLQITIFVARTNIVRLPRASLTENQMQGGHVILHIDPITDIQTVTVNRQGLALQRI